jgi:4-hydroxyphenylpyruvate dioxygenase
MLTSDYVNEYPQQTDHLGLRAIDYIEFYVGNAHQSAHYYRTAFGFAPIARTGLETGLRDRMSLALMQGDIRLVLTSPLGSEGEIANHVKLHGDGIKDIAFRVDDATWAFEQSVKRGAIPIQEPTLLEDPSGMIVKSTVATFGDTVHSFIERDAYKGTFLPGYRQIENPPPSVSMGISEVDHVAVSLQPNELDRWVEFYVDVMGFHTSHKEDVATEYSGMNSKVVQNATGAIKFPMMEPSPGKRRSQIEDYLMFYGGPGTQHVAFSSSNIIGTIRSLRTNSIEFLSTPSTYYESLGQRVGEIVEDVSALQDLNILVDRDGWGYLMQIFTRPLQSRPTFFVEVIQRMGARGFGSGNIKALFEAVEREQAIRESMVNQAAVTLEN